MNPVLLHQMLDRAARKWPDAPALTCGETTLGYGGLAAVSRRAASRLLRSGVRRGDRVVVIAPNHPATAVVAYACSRIGAVFVILHEQTRGTGLVHVLGDAEPALVLTDGAAVHEAAERYAATSSLAEFWQAVTAQPPAAEPDDPDDAELDCAPPPLAVDPLCLIYTSGSTGMPKAVVSTHAQLLFAAQAIQSCLQYQAGDVVYVSLPLSFDYCLYQLFLAALAGAHAWMPQGVDAGPALLRSLRRSRATILPAVPSLAANLARVLARYGGGLELRLLTNTGAAMPERTLAALREHIPGLRVQLMFGLTECKRVSIMPPDEDLRRPGASGLPLPGTEVAVVGDDGAMLPPGAIGELVVRGPHVMSGYWRRPDLTEQRFPRAEGLFRYLRTGDYGWLDADGYLYFSGRRDDVYKSRGNRVSTIEVEAAALRIPGIDAAAVVPPQGSKNGAVLFTVGKLDAREVLARMREDLEPFKVPDRCVVLTELPLTGNGKIDRKALAAVRDAGQAPPIAGGSTHVSTPAPSTHATPEERP
jgi:acyl-CoA synthetase (AMP-forming)/AMP-acid ligase II